MNISNFFYLIISCFVVFLFFFYKNSKGERKRQYNKALRRGDQLKAIEWGKKYYGSFNKGGKPTNFDLKQIQMDINAMNSSLPIQNDVLKKPFVK